MCLSYILHGGFIADDWAIRAQAHFTGFSGVVSSSIQGDVRRPLAALYFATTFALLGNHLKLLLILSAALRFLVSTLVYILLRELRFAWLDAVAIAALVLLFPSSDSIWLWGSESILSFTLACTLLGCLFNLRAMRQEGRCRIALRIVGLVLLAASILTYELVAPICFASGALYLMQDRVPRALREWTVDAIVFGVVIVVFTLHVVSVLHGGDTHQVSSDFSQMRAHAHLIFSQSATLLTRSLLPFGTPRNSTVLSLLGVLLVLAVAVSLLLPPGHEARQALFRWLAVIVIGALLIGLGYLLLVPANIYYVPLQPGIANRINGVAAIGYALIVYSTAAVAGTLVFRGLSRSRLLVGVSAALFTIAVGVGYARRVDSDKTAWRQSTVLQHAILTTLRSHVPRPAHGTSVITLDDQIETAPGVPVFISSWDLNGAVQLLWNDPTLKAYPMASGMNITCATGHLLVATGNSSPVWQAKYQTDLVDVTTSTVFLVKNRSGCIAAAGTLGVLVT